MSSTARARVAIRPTSLVRVTAAVFLAVLAAVPLGAGAASAQVQAGPVVATVTSRTPYQVYLAANCPAGSNFCRFTDSTVPARQVLEVQRVACQGWHTSPSLPSFVVIAELRTSTDQFVQRIDFLNTTYAPANGGSVWTISEQTLMFIPEDHKLHISLNSGTTGVGSYGCTVSGYLSVAR